MCSVVKLADVRLEPEPMCDISKCSKQLVLEEGHKKHYQIAVAICDFYSRTSASSANATHA